MPTFDAFLSDFQVRREVFITWLRYIYEFLDGHFAVMPPGTLCVKVIGDICGTSQVTVVG